MMSKNNLIISVIGLGYVGLPVAVAFAKSNYDVIGFDLNKNRLNELNLKNDKTGEVSRLDLKNTQITFTNDKNILKKANFHIITVPTPIDDLKKPDLSHIIKVYKSLGRRIQTDDIIGI